MQPQDSAPLTLARTDALHWWRAPWALERFIADLIDAEGRLMRPGGPWPPHLESVNLGATAPGASGLGFDSLECLGLAAALSEALHLNSDGRADTLLSSPTFGGWVETAAAALESGGERVVVRSSGSTGRRRSHVHTMVRLDEETATWMALLPDRRRIRSAVASHHIYGILFTLMLPAGLGISVEDVRALSPGAVLATLRPGDLVIGHPLFWESLLRAAPSGWCADVLGVTSGGYCSDSLAAELVRAGLSRLLDVYGTSETAGIGWRERTRDGWRDDRGAHHLLPGWRREGNDMLWRNDDPAPVAAPNWLQWDALGGFKIGERRDGAVVVGGVNVDPARVRSVLLAHPGVADAAVRLMQPAEGARLKAFVVPRAEAARDLDGLRGALAAHLDAALTAPERPRSYRFGSTLPLTEFGKPADWPA